MTWRVAAMLGHTRLGDSRYRSGKKRDPIQPVTAGKLMNILCRLYGRAIFAMEKPSPRAVRHGADLCLS